MAALQQCEAETEEAVQTAYTGLEQQASLLTPCSCVVASISAVSIAMVAFAAKSRRQMTIECSDANHHQVSKSALLRTSFTHGLCTVTWARAHVVRSCSCRETLTPFCLSWLCMEGCQAHFCCSYVIS